MRDDVDQYCMPAEFVHQSFSAKPPQKKPGCDCSVPVFKSCRHDESWAVNAMSAVEAERTWREIVHLKTNSASNRVSDSFAAEYRLAEAEKLSPPTVVRASIATAEPTHHLERRRQSIARATNEPGHRQSTLTSE